MSSNGNNKKGGMCRTPFGTRMVDGIPVSNHRLDKVDVTAVVLQGDTPWEYAVFADMLCKAIHNYCFWGLGQNGCTDVKWLDALDYLFIIRSEDQSTWGDRVQSYTEDLDNGKRIRHTETLTDEDMRLRCFDVHYTLLNLDQKYPLSTFLRMIEMKRQAILRENRDQVEAYLERRKAQEFAHMPTGSQMRFSYKYHDFVKTLSKPDSIRQVEELVMFPEPRIRRCSVRARNKSHSGASSWKRPNTLSEGTLYERNLLEETHVGHTHNTRERAR